MKFTVSTTGTTYTQEQAKRLGELGFEFDNQGLDAYRPKRKITQEVKIDIESLEELLQFNRKWGDLILSASHITIYDSYDE